MRRGSQCKPCMPTFPRLTTARRMALALGAAAARLSPRLRQAASQPRRATDGMHCMAAGRFGGRPTHPPAGREVFGHGQLDPTAIRLAEIALHAPGGSLAHRVPRALQLHHCTVGQAASRKVQAPPLGPALAGTCPASAHTPVGIAHAVGHASERPQPCGHSAC